MAQKVGQLVPTERSGPDELGYATVGREVAGSAPERPKVPKMKKVIHNESGSHLLALQAVI